MKKWQQREVGVVRAGVSPVPPAVPVPGRREGALAPHRFPALRAGFQDTPDSDHPDRGRPLSPERLQVSPPAPPGAEASLPRRPREAGLS